MIVLVKLFKETVNDSNRLKTKSAKLSKSNFRAV